MRNRHYPGIVLVFLILATVHQIWLSANIQPVVWDEARHLLISLAYYDWFTIFKGTESHIRVTQGVLEGRYPPLTYLITVPFYVILGRSLHTGISIQLVFLFITVLYIHKTVFLMTRKNWCALLAAVLCGFSPLYIHFTRRFLLDIPTASWTVVFLYYLLKSEHFQYAKPSIAAGLTGALGLLTRPNLLPMIAFPSLLGFVLGIMPAASRSRVTRNAILCGLCLILVALPWYMVYYTEQSGFLSSQRMYNEPYNADVFSPESFLFFPSVASLNFGYGIVALIGIGMIIATVQRHWQALMIIISLLSGYVFLVWMPYKDWRFFVQLVPCMAVLGTYWIAQLRYLQMKVIFSGWILGFALINFLRVGLDVQLPQILDQNPLPAFYRYGQRSASVKLHFLNNIKTFPFRDPPRIVHYSSDPLIEFIQNQEGRKLPKKIGVFPCEEVLNPMGLSYYSALKRYPVAYTWVHDMRIFHKTWRSYDFLVAPINREVFLYPRRWEVEKERIFGLRIKEGIFTPLREFEFPDDIRIGVYRVSP